ncbi:MAG TPA: GAF domain-containing protein [Vicinamibacterales bacterium]|jgi:GAF domain-containing protein|nr:GAF domain-containing protein [Vicinamibacterales bacterium]
MSDELLAIVRSVSRLAALQRLSILDTPPEAALDRLTRIACRMLHAPIGLVSLVDRDRQFFKSCVGLPQPIASERQTPLSHSFCKHVVGSAKPLIVDDARVNPLVQMNPAIQLMGIAAYAGIPLTTSDGHVIGSFCVIDSRPRTWSYEDVETLQELATCVMHEVEGRKLLQESEARCRQLETRLRQVESEGKTSEPQEPRTPGTLRTPGTH